MSSQSRKDVGRREGRGTGRNMPIKDLAAVLGGWDHEPGTFNVRTVCGADGKTKIQVRLELGVLQFEPDGRPDGRRVGGRPTALHAALARRRQSPEDFALDADAAAVLRDEAAMVHQRCVAYYVLEDYECQARDAAHNLRIADLLRRHAGRPADAQSLDEWRPYMLMLHARGLAAVQLARGDVGAALDTLRRGLRRMRRAFGPAGRRAFRKSGERRLLASFGREIQAALPADPLALLRRKLDAAVEREEFEAAATLRDEIARLRAA